MAKFCGKCGAKADNGAKFCPECGEPLKQTEPPFVPPVVPRKTWNTIAVCIAMVILVVGRIVILPEKSEFIKTSSSIWSYSKKATDWNNNLYTVFSVDGIRINPVDYIEYKKGPDYDALAYILNHNPDILGGTFVRTQSINGEAGCILADDGTLYYIRAYGTVTVPGEILPLAENVLSCAISADGTGVAYVDDSEVLMLCSCDDDKKIRIANNVVMGPKLSSFVISPDGNALAYITKQNDSESVAFYAYYDGKRVKIGENLIPVGISNKGKYIYYLSQEKDCLYVSNMNGEVKKLSANINPSGRYFFNSNMTQLIFSADGKWYLSVNGADKVKLTESDSDWLYSVAPQGCPRLSNAGRSENGPAYIYPLKNLTGHYFQEYDGKLFYINEKNRPADVICERTNFAQLTDDESALFYTEQQGNRYIACKTENTEFSAIVQIAEGTSPFIFTSNGETVHYCDNENTLWYQRADEKPKHIADDVHYFTLSHDNYVLFITDYSNSSGILYGCANGKDPQQILSDCFSVPTIYPTVSIIYANYDKASGTFDIYTADNGMNFEKIEEGAHW